MGIAAGILYEKKRNLLFPILVHFANNLITMLQGFAPSEVNELISIFILIMIAPAGYVVCRSLKQGKRADSMYGFYTMYKAYSGTEQTLCAAVFLSS